MRDRVVMLHRLDPGAQPLGMPLADTPSPIPLLRCHLVDRRRVALQIRAILVPYRVERRRRDSATMEQFRLRARFMIDGLEESVGADPELQKALADARQEIDADEP
jgi:hypothetical protein